MTSPKMSARAALEIVKGERPDRRYGWDDVASLEEARANYARACAILAALVDECEAFDLRRRSVLAEDHKHWNAAMRKRRKLERGEES